MARDEINHLPLPARGLSAATSAPEAYEALLFNSSNMPGGIASDNSDFDNDSVDKSRGLPKLIRTNRLNFQVCFIVILTCFWENFPFAVLGMPSTVGYQAYAVLVFAGTLLFFARTLMRGWRPSIWEGLSLLFFFWCGAVSCYFSTVQSPQPLMGWLPAVYTIAPLLTIFALKAIDCTLDDAMVALFWTGLAATVFLLVTNLMQIPILEPYSRGSGFGTNDRIVFFKLESTFALMIATMLFINSDRLYKRFLQPLIIFVLAYNVFVASESRLAMLAYLLAFFLIWVFVFNGARRVIVALFAPVVLVPLVWFVAGKYMRGINGYMGLKLYLAEDVSARFRSWEIAHFSKYFGYTNGLGFGFMSGNIRFDNIISYATNKAGYEVGTGTYGMGLDDIGLYSALYQFGYFGLAIVLVMTFMVVITLGGSARYGKKFAPTAGCGMLAGTFMLSPISMNFFTLFYTAHMGALLWFMASEAATLGRRETLIGRFAR
jgi:hypothetical protein